MGSLTKADMAERLHKNYQMSRREAKALVEAFFNEISNSLIANEEVKISGFGNFSLRDKHARPGRNPKTGQPVNISARRVVTFRAGQKLKERVE